MSMNGNLEFAYINLVRFSSALLKTFPSLGSTAVSDKRNYTTLKNNYLKWALEESDNIKKKWIQKKHQELIEQKSKLSKPSLSSSPSPLLTSFHSSTSPTSTRSLGSVTNSFNSLPSSTYPTASLGRDGVTTYSSSSSSSSISPSYSSFSNPSTVSSNVSILRPSLNATKLEINSPLSSNLSSTTIRRPNYTATHSFSPKSTMINTTQDFLLRKVQARSPTSMVLEKSLPFSSSSIHSSRLEEIMNPFSFPLSNSTLSSQTVSTHRLLSSTPFNPSDSSSSSSSSPSTFSSSSSPLSPMYRKKEDLITYKKPLSPISPFFSSSKVYMEPRFHQSESNLSKVVRGAVGLKNLGNTCFMNSILQCLYGTVPLVRFFASGEFRQSINRSNPLGTQGRVAIAFFQLIQDMQRNASSFVAPVLFKETLEELAPHMMDGTQQDAQEFLTFVLEALHEDLKRSSTQPLPPPNNDDLDTLVIHEASPIAWQRYLIKNQSFLVDLFQGQLASTLKCTICNYTSTTYSPFMYLSLPLPTPQISSLSNLSYTLAQCLEEFLRPAILDGNDAWQCPQCRRLTRSIQTTQITRFPFILLLHLKRFSYSGMFRNKLDSLVQFPLQGLELHPNYSESSLLSSVKPPSYQLYAVSNHYGGLDGGHYTAVVKHGDGHWYYFDDSRVSQCSKDKIITSAAYNLFYVSTS